MLSKAHGRNRRLFENRPSVARLYLRCASALPAQPTLAEPLVRTLAAPPAYVPATVAMAQLTGGSGCLALRAGVCGPHPSEHWPRGPPAHAARSAHGTTTAPTVSAGLPVPCTLVMVDTT